MHVAQLAIFPLKSGRALLVEATTVEARGFAGDRRWMLIDSVGRFVTQRERPALARLDAVPTPRGLFLTLDGDALEVAVPPAAAERVAATVWGDELHLREAADAASWLSRRLHRPLRLVHHADDVVRPVSRAWAAEGDEVSLADGFPVLVATTASLVELERHVGAPLGMARFRPNLVVDGAAAWAEDGWARLRIGEVELDLVKPCARCIITTVDQQRGVIAGEEPLAGLRRTRLSGDRRVPGVLFGWNAVPRRLGRVALGDPVEVIATRAPWPVRARAA